MIGDDQRDNLLKSVAKTYTFFLQVFLNKFFFDNFQQNVV